jgi:hypothetical protein
MSDLCIHDKPLGACDTCWEAVRLMQQGNATVKEATSVALKRTALRRGRSPLPTTDKRERVVVWLDKVTIAAIESQRQGDEPLGRTIDRLIAHQP